MEEAETALWRVFEALERKLARFYSLDEYSIRFRCTGDTNWAWFSYFHLTTLHDISQIIEHSYNHLSFFLCSSLSLSLSLFFSVTYMSNRKMVC